MLLAPPAPFSLQIEIRERERKTERKREIGREREGTYIRSTRDSGEIIVDAVVSGVGAVGVILLIANGCNVSLVKLREILALKHFSSSRDITTRSKL